MINFSLTKHIRRGYQPTKTIIAKWLKKSLINSYKIVSIEISIVDTATSQKLNQQYRNKNYPTNIITLEYANTRENFAMLSGELILCDDIISKEAKEQNKTIFDHYAHLIIHGMLHLQGLDHISEDEANYMENMEINILSQFAIKNPYVIMENI
jgi:probable rRNA maturation factor